MQSVMTDVAAYAPAADFSPAPAREVPEAFAVEVVRTLESLDTLAADWRALQELSGPASVFQCCGQIRIWARHFSAGGRTRERLHVAVVREAGRPLLILPLVLSGRAPFRIARLAGDPIAQYADLLVDPAICGRGALDAALASVRRAGAAAIVLRRVRRDSHLFRLAGDRLGPPSAASTAPWADLAPYDSFDAYRQSLSKKVRQALRHRGNHLERAGSYAFELLPGGPQARAALADAIAMKRRWLIHRGEISSAFMEPRTRDCLLALAGERDTGAVVTRLVVGGEPAAIRLGFEYQGAHYSYLSAYDESFASLSPGKLLMGFTIERFPERGLRRVDMLPPGGRHKMDWCRLETAVADYTLPLTLAGRAYAAGYRQRLRPALQRAWQRLPDALRSRAAAMLVGI
jgi:CelD/BcsL family acetyltransferase involved in cellulose biosynthesis